MNEYKIKVTKISSRIVTVTAQSERDAVDIVETQYANEDIVLDNSDYDNVKIEVD